MKYDFRFTLTQRENLLACWKRPADKKIAAAFVNEVQGIIARWLHENSRHPPTSIGNQISLANDLATKAEDLRRALENMPKDVADLIGVGWLREKYGEEYFEQHSEACRKDAENGIRMSLMAGLRAFAPDGADKSETIQSERSKLPSDFHQATEEAKDYLSSLVITAGNMSKMLRGARQWHNKEAEKELLLSLSLSYSHHFGKPPSAANARTGQPESASPFRKFLSELEPMIGCQFGAPLIRNTV